MGTQEVELFASTLEIAGYEGAHALIDTDLIPLARKRGISLFDAAWEYSDRAEEQDTSWHQLYRALTETPEEVFDSLEIHDPVT